jgi:hypothetical protein
MVVCILMGSERVPCRCSGSLGHLEFLIFLPRLAVVYPGQTTGGSISFCLRVGLLLERLDSTLHVSTVQDILRVEDGILPALMNLSLGVCGQVCVRLEPLCALDAVVLS